MNKTIAITAAILIAGFALFMIRESTRDATNRQAIGRVISAGSSTSPASTPGQDARHRQRARDSKAGARHRRSQQ